MLACIRAGLCVDSSYLNDIQRTIRNSSMSERNWRPTMFKGRDGVRGVIQDSWTLVDEAGQAVAKISLETDGTDMGRWRWFILALPHGAPSGATGLCRTKEEAKTICERHVPDWTRARLPQGRRRPFLS